MACQNGHLEIVQNFLAVGVDPSVASGALDATPLIVAAENERVQVIAELIKTGVGLDHLSEEAAEELSRCRADWLTIGGGYQKTSSGTLSLGYLDSISETTASALSRFQGQTLMLFVKHISEEVAVALSHYPGVLTLATPTVESSEQ